MAENYLQSADVGLHSRILGTSRPYSTRVLYNAYTDREREREREKQRERARERERERESVMQRPMAICQLSLTSLVSTGEDLRYVYGANIIDNPAKIKLDS